MGVDIGGKRHRLLAIDRLRGICTAAPRSDRLRHNEKVKEVIKQNLGEIIGQQDIITAKTVKSSKSRSAGWSSPHIRYDPHGKKGVGQRPGGSQPGDVIGRSGQQGQGAGKQAGTEPGVDFYEAEFTIEELVQMVSEDLHLPNLREKGTKDILADQIHSDTLARRGPQSNIDKKAHAHQRLETQRRRRQPLAGRSARKTNDLNAGRLCLKSSATRSSSRCAMCRAVRVSLKPISHAASTTG